MPSSLQDYFDAAAESRDRPRAASTTTTPRHPPNASRSSRHASNPTPQVHSSARSSRHSSREQPSHGSARPIPAPPTTRGPRRSSQNATLRSSQGSRTPFRSAAETEDPPPP